MKRSKNKHPDNSKRYAPGHLYYDGPVVDSGRTMEEIGADIEREKERMAHMEWPPKYNGE